MKLTREEGRAVIYGDDERFETVEKTIDETTRWSVLKSIVFKEKATGKFYCMGYSVGATEQQDEGPFEYTEPEVFEVVPVTKTVTVYERPQDEVAP